MKFLAHLCGLPGQFGLSHKTLPGIVFSEQELQFFPVYSLWEMITDDVSKVFALYTEKKEKRLQEIMVEHKRY